MGQGVFLAQRLLGAWAEDQGPGIAGKSIQKHGISLSYREVPRKKKKKKFFFQK